jgi:hypothetical protein
MGAAVTLRDGANTASRGLAAEGVRLLGSSSGDRRRTSPSRICSRPKFAFTHPTDAWGCCPTQAFELSGGSIRTRVCRLPHRRRACLRLPGRARSAEGRRRPGRLRGRPGI